MDTERTQNSASYRGLQGLMQWLRPCQIFRPCEPVSSDGITGCDDCQKKAPTQKCLREDPEMLTDAYCSRSRRRTYLAASMSRPVK